MNLSRPFGSNSWVNNIQKGGINSGKSATDIWRIPSLKLFIDKESLNELKGTIGSFLGAQGFELADLFYKSEARKLILRILVDLPRGGITMDQCAELNHKISEVLDAKNVINESYILEVCSPGLDRPLRDMRDFKRCIDREIVVYLSDPVEGKLQYTGVIKDIDQDLLHLDIGVKFLGIPLDKVTKAKQLVD